MALIQMANVITSPAQPTGINVPRQYPKTGGTLKFLSEINALNYANWLHELKVIRPSDLVILQQFDLNALNLNHTTSEFQQAINLTSAAIMVNQIYWFELGLKLTGNTQLEHRVHRVRVEIV